MRKHNVFWDCAIGLALVSMVIYSNWYVEAGEIDMCNISAVNVASLSLNSTDSYTGQISLETDCPGITAVEGWRTVVFVDGAEEYSISMWMKADSPMALVLDPGSGYGEDNIGANLGTTWQQYTVTVPAERSIGTLGTPAGHWFAVYTGYPQVGTFYVDGIEIINGYPTWSAETSERSVNINALCDELGVILDQQVSPTRFYKNHGQYVSQVAHAADSLVAAECNLSVDEAEELHSCLVSTRAKLDVGKKQ